MKYPNTLIIGVQKAGTTSLFNWLSQHPNIYAPNILKDRYPVFLYEENYEKELINYQKFFKNIRNEKIALAASVNYIFFEYALKRIKKFNPEIKLILILRNPIKRAFSAYNYAKQRGLEDRTFKEAIYEELQNKNLYKSRFELSQKAYIEHGFYYKQIKILQNYFPLDQVFIGFYEKMILQKQEFIQNIFSFLNIEKNVPINFTYNNITMGGSKIKFINKLLYNRELLNSFPIKYIKNLISPETRTSIFNNLERLNKKKEKIPQIDLDTQNLLFEIYYKDILNLQKLLKKDLSFWIESNKLK